MSGVKGVFRSNIRFDPEMGEDGTFLLRCEQCARSGDGTAFWPLTKEYWAVEQGFQRCRACHNTRKRLRQKQTDDQRRAKMREWYHNDRENRLRYAAEYLEANRERVNARRRQRNAERREEINARRREQSAQKKDRAA